MHSDPDRESQAKGDYHHLVPDVPAGLGRDIRDMPISCARTHPDANKHTRRIPMYRPVHSAHAKQVLPGISLQCYFLSERWPNWIYCFQR